MHLSSIEAAILKTGESAVCPNSNHVDVVPGKLFFFVPSTTLQDSKRQRGWGMVPVFVAFFGEKFEPHFSLQKLAD